MIDNVEDAFKVLEQEKVITIIGKQYASQRIDDYIVSLKSSFRPIDEHIILDLKINDCTSSVPINRVAKEIADIFNDSSHSFSQFSLLDYFSHEFPEKKLYIILKNPFFLSDQNEDTTVVLKTRCLIEKIRFCENVFLVISIVESEKSGFYDSYYSELKSKYIAQTYKLWISSSDM
jgi:hypothetical protein